MNYLFKKPELMLIFRIVHIISATNIAGSTRMPYIALGETEGVQTDAVPNVDDGLSLPIDVAFPMGSRIHSTIYVSLHFAHRFVLNNNGTWQSNSHCS